MFRSLICRHRLACVVFIIFTFLAPVADSLATTHNLAGIDLEGHFIDSGYTYQVPDAMDPNFNPIYEASDATHFLFDIDALLPTLAPLPITFARNASPTAMKLVLRRTEVYWNQTGTDWSAIRFDVPAGLTLSALDGGNLATWDINPFNTLTFNPDHSSLLVSGGSFGIPNGFFWSPNPDNSIGLQINNNSSASSFPFTITPIPVPEPTAAMMLLPPAFALLAARRRRW